MANQTTLHIEKGQCFVGTDTSRPVDMNRPEFSGLKEVISKQAITDGDYRWDADTKNLVPVGGAGDRL